MNEKLKSRELVLDAVETEKWKVEKERNSDEAGKEKFYLVLKTNIWNCTELIG